MKHIDKEDFREAVYEIVRTVPYGRATSYGAIAKAISCPNLSRMVGRIMGECNSAENDIPAHRVVNSNGILSGKNAFGTSGEMQKRLEAEGIVVINDKIKDWKSIFWNPIEEINI